MQCTNHTICTKTSHCNIILLFLQNIWWMYYVQFSAMILIISTFKVCVAHKAK